MIQPAASFFFLVQLGTMWIALFVTGRIFDSITKEEGASVKDDALASLVIVVISAIANVVIPSLHLPAGLGLVIYFGLIYYAFQLDGLYDLVVFYILHTVILAVVFWLGILSLPLGNDIAGGAVTPM
ncbi:MAG: hypothetical protein ABIH23_24965 [bacterium]